MHFASFEKWDLTILNVDFCRSAHWNLRTGLCLQLLYVWRISWVMCVLTTFCFLSQTQLQAHSAAGSRSGGIREFLPSPCLKKRWHLFWEGMELSKEMNYLSRKESAHQLSLLFSFFLCYLLLCLLPKPVLVFRRLTCETHRALSSPSR